MSPERSCTERAIEAIDAVNAQDPTQIDDAGVRRPKELVHAEHMTSWLARLRPDAGDAQRIAARGHHLRRWASPRASYPDGRSGYLQWRTAAKRRHVAELSELLRSVGCADEVIADVARIVSKERRADDPQVQDHEDALCLTFCELQLDELLERLGHDHMVQVVAKTMAKMSPAAIALVGEIDLTAAGRAVVADAAATA